MNKNIKKHIDWFISHGVEQVDFGIFNRIYNKMNLKLNCDICDIDKIIGMCGYKNSENHCIYIRPARSKSHAIVFVDDVDISTMKHFIKKFDAVAIRTSAEGGFQMWIATDTLLNEPERKIIQTFIQPFLKSDPHSLSGEHFGRLAGFKNHKRAGQWVNVYHINNNGRKISTTKALEQKQNPTPSQRPLNASRRRTAAYTDRIDNNDPKGILKALSKIENNGDRGLWVSVGAGLYSVNKREAWDAWSQQSAKYNSREQERTWSGFKNSSVSIGIIFHIAYAIVDPSVKTIIYRV